MKLYYKNTLVLEICGKNTVKDIVVNLLYGTKYFFIYFREVMQNTKETLKMKEVPR